MGQEESAESMIDRLTWWKDIVICNVRVEFKLCKVQNYQTSRIMMNIERFYMLTRIYFARICIYKKNKILNVT